jgi:hypothetical protein
MTLNRWARMFLVTGGIMFSIGMVPLLMVNFLFPGSTSLIPMMLSLLVAPVGALILATGLVIWAVAWWIGTPQR